MSSIAKILISMFLGLLLAGGSGHLLNEQAYGATQSGAVKCNQTMVANIIAIEGHNVGIYLDEEQDTLVNYRCQAGHLRLWKISANTKSETRQLYEFWRAYHPGGYPTLWCQTTLDRGYILDLAYYWTKLKYISGYERDNYIPWAKNYAERHHCVY